MESIGSTPLWVGFTLFVLTMLAVDLGVFHRKAHVVSVREALIWTALWISLALSFGVGVFFFYGSKPALEFLTGYIIEETLSIDNLFVFMVLFSYFKVPPVLQHRVLFWGILGALVMRAAFIFAGAALVHQFHWIMYVFGAFLVYTGIKLLMGNDEDVDPEDNYVLKLFRRFVPAVPNYRGPAFIVVENGKRYATPLLAVLVAIEATDVMFAVDSIPAIFAVTQDPFVIYTSNIFAIMGLRSLFFALNGMMGKFHYLKVGLGLILSFVGVKMLIADVLHVPVGISLLVISTILGGSVVASLVWPAPAPAPASEADEAARKANHS